MERLGRGMSRCAASHHAGLCRVAAAGQRSQRHRVQSLPFGQRRRGGEGQQRAAHQDHRLYGHAGESATTAYTYSVKPVLNGVEVPDIWANPLAPPATLPANAPMRQYLSVPIQSVPQYPGDATDTSAYNVKFCWVGDLDGDGEYDFVMDRTSIDSANTHRQYIDAYKRDGTFLWRVNMGSNSLNQDNISPGSAAISIGMWDGIEAYDMDGDGKAEVIIKAANDTRLPDGTIVTNSNTSVQYLIVLDGMTGVERARIQWPTDYITDGPMGMSLRHRLSQRRDSQPRRQRQKPPILRRLQHDGVRFQFQRERDDATVEMEKHDLRGCPPASHHGRQQRREGRSARSSLRPQPRWHGALQSQHAGNRPRRPFPHHGHGSGSPWTGDFPHSTGQPHPARHRAD